MYNSAEVHFKRRSLFTSWECDKIVWKSRRTLSASLDFQVHTEWVQVTFCPRSFYLSKYNLKTPSLGTLYYTVLKNLEKKVCKGHTWWGGWGIGQGLRTISLAVPPTISFSVSEAITGQQSTTAPQLSCLWFLIKTKRRDPSKNFVCLSGNTSYHLHNGYDYNVVWKMITLLFTFSNTIGQAQRDKISSFSFYAVCHANIVTIRTIIVIETWIIQRSDAVSSVPTRHNQYAVWCLHRGKVHYKFECIWVASEPKSNLMLISPGTAQETSRQTNKQNQHKSWYMQPWGTQAVLYKSVDSGFILITQSSNLWLFKGLVTELTKIN